MLDRPTHIRQILNYPMQAAALPGDAILMQTGGMGGPYVTTTAAGVVEGAMEAAGAQLGIGLGLPGDAEDTGLVAVQVTTPVGCTFGWGWYQSETGARLLGAAAAARMCWDGVTFSLSSGAGDPVNFVPLLSLTAQAFTVPGVGLSVTSAQFQYDGFRMAGGNLTVPGDAAIGGTATLGHDPLLPLQAVTKRYADALLATALAMTVHSFNGRQGQVRLALEDLLEAGGAPIVSPEFRGAPTCPTIPPDDCTWRLANGRAVQAMIARAFQLFDVANRGVTSFNGRVGNVCLTIEDLLRAGGMPAPIVGEPPDNPVTGQIVVDGDQAQIWNGTQWIDLGIGEAPQDGGLYARQNGAWVRLLDDGEY